MNKIRQRIVIAEKIGFTGVYPCDFDGGFHGFYKGRVNFVPDYPNDLNAMHEAENWLRTRKISWVKYESSIGKCDTAAQRAEAFCKVFWPKKFN